MVTFAVVLHYVLRVDIINPFKLTIIFVTIQTFTISVLF